MAEKPAASLTLNINFNWILEPAKAAAYRATAFLTIGLRSIELPKPDSLNLDGGMAIKFWPEPLSEENWNAASFEFRRWLVGACLRELDHYFSLFLDRAWTALNFADLHNTKVPSDTVLSMDKEFSRKTNVGEKIGMVCDRIGIAPQSDQFKSLSRARNALAHNAGRVRSEDLTDGIFKVSWHTFIVVIDEEGRETSFRPGALTPHEITAPEGAHISLRLTEQSRVFGLSEKLSFTPHELMEICMFYWGHAGRIAQQMAEYMRQKGMKDIS